MSKLIPESVMYPTPLKIYTISLQEYYTQDNKTEYLFLLTVANWHHMEI